MRKQVVVTTVDAAAGLTFSSGVETVTVVRAPTPPTTILPSSPIRSPAT
jgi:hypothetical protein